MSRARFVRAVGLVAVVLLNLAILALPSRAGWYDTLCETGGEPVPCCAFCVICWGCDLEEVQQ